ncbi:MAG TPA: cupin domain-containing protein [Candidatus Caccocola faecipullorum]|nr:cupin domain-containing protein [Candidatus Caccocola faecipullorum]
MTDFKDSLIFPAGERFDNENFSGEVWLKMLTGMPCPVANVTFAPACRNNWHTHRGGQILLVTAGRGFYQEWGKEARELRAGDVVEIPAEVKHWHGAAPDSWFSHIAMEIHPELGPATWLEPVSEEEYGKLK